MARWSQRSSCLPLGRFTRTTLPSRQIQKAQIPPGLVFCSHREISRELVWLTWEAGRTLPWGSCKSRVGLLKLRKLHLFDGIWRIWPVIFTLQMASLTCRCFYFFLMRFSSNVYLLNQVIKKITFPSWSPLWFFCLRKLGHTTTFSHEHDHRTVSADTRVILIKWTFSPPSSSC